MATAKGSEATEFERTITRTRREIEKRFLELVACVEERKRELLQQLDEISTAHRKANEGMHQSVSELEELFKQSEEKFNSKELKELQATMIEKMRAKRKELDCELGSEELFLEWDESVMDGVRKLGVLSGRGVYGSCPVVDCVGKANPVVNIGTQGSEDGQFNNPCGLSIANESGNIYVADENNNRIQVFDSEGKYLYKFGDAIGNGKMYLPSYIAISNGRVLVSQFGAGCLLVFDLKGNFIERIGGRGSGDLQFNAPNGIAVNRENGDVYVCDYHNRRIQILSKDLIYKSKFAVREPRDVKLTSEHIYVLSASNPFLFIFNYEYTRVLKDMSIFIAGHLRNPWGLCIDGAGKFIISDQTKNRIIIFGKKGKLPYQLDDSSIINPAGVSIDKKGRIVCVCQKPSLLIF